MKPRRTQKTKPQSRGPAQILAQREDRYVFIRKRESRHRLAILKLEKEFGPKAFTVPAAARAGIGPPLLRELVQLKFVTTDSAGCHAINRDMRDHTEPVETEVPYIQATYAALAGGPAPEPDEASRISRACRTADLAPKADHWKVMHVTKRFRMPYELYLLLRPQMDNLSAYVRYLIYKDQDMEAEAAREKKRMGKKERPD